MANQIKLRRDISGNWYDVNPVLGQGEPGLELDSGKLKIGNGSTAWRNLPYLDTTNFPPDQLGYLLNDGTGNLVWAPIVQINSDWDASSGTAQILNKPDIPKDINELTDVDKLLTPEFVKILENSISDIIPFDFGTITIRQVKNKLEWMLYHNDIDNGTITEPAQVDHDAGTLI